MVVKNGDSLQVESVKNFPSINPSTNTEKNTTHLLRDVFLGGNAWFLHEKNGINEFFELDINSTR